MPPEPPSRDDGVTITCLVCGGPVRRSGRRRFCSAACRQAADRRRHPPPLPPLPVRSPRARTVYQCPTCETRYFGEHYCPDCGCFCRRLGPGGLCPACEEPVALCDLMAEGGDRPTPS
jgi:hypothetical protein